MGERELMRAAEFGEVGYMRAWFELASEPVRTELGMTCARIGGGVVTVMANGPAAMFWSRAIGLGIDEPVTAAVLDEVTAFARDNGAQGLVFQVAPGADPQDWPTLLEGIGAGPSRNWVKFAGDCTPRDQPPTDLRLDVAGPEHADDFGRVMATSFGFPPDSVYARWYGELTGAANHGATAYAAWDDDVMVAVAVLVVADDIASLCGAGTLESHRGRGAQGALMARRVNDAVASGCRWLSTETGAETAEDPNPSLHNMRRLGLTELYERTNWIWQAG